MSIIPANAISRHHRRRIAGLPKEAGGGIIGDALGYIGNLLNPFASKPKPSAATMGRTNAWKRLQEASMKGQGIRKRKRKMYR